MTHNAHDSIQHLLVDLSTLVPLEGNPRSGNVDAIIASYREFGQMKPIVVRPNGDGTSTVIAGNHQMQAAKRLGWTHIAAVEMDTDVSTAVAFALADNRTTELGSSDNVKVLSLLEDVITEYPNLFEDLGWDEFEIAYYEEQVPTSARPAEPGFVAPEIQRPLTVPEPTHSVREDENGKMQIVANSDDDQNDLAVRGSTVSGVANAPQAVVQYTIVFDSTDQQRRWYDFVRWVKQQPAYDGSTVAEKLINFIDAHSEV
jgi:hypothetical protein